MKITPEAVAQTAPDWQPVKKIADLQAKKVTMVKIHGKQIALFQTTRGLRACDNRCPHEGYPLSEGSVSENCVLTCNWHNWKFDLENGDNLYGGDRLRTYPVEQRGEQIWVDISDPPYAERYHEITSSLHDAFDDEAYDRIAREIARLINIGGDPLDALRLTIEWSWQRLKYGWTHAYGAMADWLVVYEENQNDAELQLVCLIESVGHAAFDVLRERDYPYSDAVAPFDEDIFLAAIEQEDEATAIAHLRGAFQAGLGFRDLEYAFTRAALAHYHDFGHSLIYVSKVGYLIDTLDDSVAQPLLLSLVRNLIFAYREDNIPEFSAYQPTLDAWHENAPAAQATTKPAATQLQRKGIKQSLAYTLANRAHEPADLYPPLLLANAYNLLHFDLSQQDKAHLPISGNVGWLSFTHGVTFSNAVRKQCKRYPELWPQGLLQMACFCGRNVAFTSPEEDKSQWYSEDPQTELEQLLERVYDHGLGEYIISVHWLKTALAVREEIEHCEPADAQLLLAALKRFISSPLKRRQTRRTAHQSLEFVANGG